MSSFGNSPGHEPWNRYKKAWWIGLGTSGSTLAVSVSTYLCPYCAPVKAANATERQDPKPFLERDSGWFALDSRLGLWRSIFLCLHTEQPKAPLESPLRLGRRSVPSIGLCICVQLSQGPPVPLQDARSKHQARAIVFNDWPDNRLIVENFFCRSKSAVRFSLFTSNQI
jgi:hypothetical protein